MYQILVCDDEKDAAAALGASLRAAGYQVLEAEDANKAVELLSRNEIHLVLLDDMLPPDNGLALLSSIRLRSNVPVILISANAGDNNKIDGLNSGADDYITKPFNPVEVVARVRSQLRRYLQLGGVDQKATKITVGALCLNKQSKTVTVDGESVSLTPLEYDILALLMENPGRVYSSKEIYGIVWNAPPMGAENAVAVHIRHIREKIEQNPAAPKYLRVVWGKGYKLQDAE